MSAGKVRSMKLLLIQGIYLFEVINYTGYFYPSHAEHMMDSKEIGEAD